MRGLAGKRVLISGGSSGIGKAAARRMLEEGTRVHIGGVSDAELDEAVDDLRGLGTVSATTADVSEVGGAGRLVSEARSAMGGVDVLLNNAGVAWREPFLTITPEHWDRMMAVNLRGMFFVAQRVADLMTQQKSGGVIVNMSSTNGLQGEPEYAHYNVSKGAALLLTRTMAVELASHRIRVNALCPGYIETPLNARIAGAIGEESFVSDYIQQKIPLGRTGQADDVAAAYAFLASDDAAFITGAALVVDGGQTALM